MSPSWDRGTNGLQMRGFGACPLGSASDGTHVNRSSGSERFAKADLAGLLDTRSARKPVAAGNAAN